MDLTLLVKALGAFFAIMNPFVNLPLFLSLTAGQEPAQQRRTAWRTTLFSALMCAVVAVSGSALLRFFGISLDDFRVAGGLVLLTIALGMLSGRGASAHEGSKTEKAHAVDYAAANDVAVTGAQRHNAQDGGGVDGGAALLGDGDRDALLGDGLDEGGGGAGVQPDLGSDGGGDLCHERLL